MADKILKFGVCEVENIVRQVASVIETQPINIIQKEGFSNIVTNLDLRIQQLLIENLSHLITDCGFLCEESDFIDTQNKEFVWIIDPIDGTMNFSRGIPNFCISVALMQNKEILLGVVYNPTTKEMFSATRGGGAHLNNKIIKVSERNYEDGILCTAMSLYKKQYAKICSDIILDAYLECNDIRRFGSCALELCYLAMGVCELFFEFRVMPWDYAAGYLILSEAGGILSGYNNQNLNIDKPTLLIGANNITNHQKLITFVNKYINPKECNYEWQNW
ncbi:MAG: inositol monophosphatase [Rikenellaceae bacterium]|nr:inositol monophosphatase [Rikenellaceae bacterium]MBR2629061.1 inositol monophosphatase [Alistipes sp.]